MDKNGFIFTLDALLAVLIGGILITSTYVLLSGGSPSSARQNLYQVALDSLTVLEKDHTLADAIETSSNADLDNFLDALPVHICGNITLYRNTTAGVLSSQGDCAVSDPVVARRIFVTDFTSYYAEARMGFRS
ncbi:MAG TPA: hypothetical protein VJB08_00580 [Candidatus Nanoarchaeia archaeon]|nr:hypothetical protein [Candidatus Nanoarchaeia archaeon]